MDGEEIFDSFNASGSADVGMFKPKDIKQENFDGWELGMLLHESLIIWNFYTPTVSGVYIAIVFFVSQPVCYHIFLIFHNRVETKISERGLFFLIS